MVQAETFTAPNLFRLWGIVVVAAIVITILGMILATIGSTIVHSIRTNEAPSEQEYVEDERDKLIGLKGTRVTYTLSSLGVFAAMIIYVLNQQPLMMFSLLVASGLVAQIVGDVYRLVRYSRGV